MRERPVAPENFLRHRNWGKRLASFLLCQAPDLMPQKHRPPTSMEIAVVAAKVLLYEQRGMVIADADQARNRQEAGMV